MTDEEKISILWEEKQIKKVMLRFGRALDLQDWPSYRSCFTDIVNIDFKRLTGFDEVRVDADLWTIFAEQILSPVRCQHAYSNWSIDIDGDQAYALVYFAARSWKATDIGASTNTQYGWYNVWFERHHDTWLIARLKHDFQWVTGNGALLDTNEPVLAATMRQLFNVANIAAARPTQLRHNYQRGELP